MRYYNFQKYSFNIIVLMLFITISSALAEEAKVKVSNQTEYTLLISPYNADFGNIRLKPGKSEYLNTKYAVIHNGSLAHDFVRSLYILAEKKNYTPYLYEPKSLYYDYCGGSYSKSIIEEREIGFRDNGTFDYTIQSCDISYNGEGMKYTIEYN